MKNHNKIYFVRRRQLNLKVNECDRYHRLNFILYKSCVRRKKNITQSCILQIRYYYFREECDLFKFTLFLLILDF